MQVGVKKTKILQNKKSREKKIHYFPKARFISVSDATLPPPPKKKKNPEHWFLHCSLPVKPPGRSRTLDTRQSTPPATSGPLDKTTKSQAAKSVIYQR